jgi:hypothetical protein
LSASTSVVETLLRMTLLSIGAMAAVMFLVTGLIWIGLAAMPNH